MRKEVPSGATAFREIPGVPLAELGESPWWDQDGGHLFWVDITGGRLHRYLPSSGRCDTHVVGGEIGFAMLERSGEVVAGIGDGIYAFTFGKADRHLIARPVMHGDNRFNDAACDPCGRLWAGTMHRRASRELPATGALYRWSDDGLDLVEGDVAIANGLGWSPDGTTMYFADTHRGVIWAYDYHLEAGVSGRRRAFATIPRETGVPDGLTVDSAGRVFVAVWRGGRINVYTPDGELEEVHVTPVAHPTSCCFGGADFKTLFVTTARNGLSPAEAAQDTLSGRLFAMPARHPGLPSARMNLPRRPAL